MDSRHHRCWHAAKRDRERRRRRLSSLDVVGEGAYSSDTPPNSPAAAPPLAVSTPVPSTPSPPPSTASPPSPASTTTTALPPKADDGVEHDFAKTSDLEAFEIIEGKWSVVEGVLVGEGFPSTRARLKQKCANLALAAWDVELTTLSPNQRDPEKNTYAAVGVQGARCAGRRRASPVDISAPIERTILIRRSSLQPYALVQGRTDLNRVSYCNDFATRRSGRLRPAVPGLFAGSGPDPRRRHKSNSEPTAGSPTATSPRTAWRTKSSYRFITEWRRSTTFESVTRLPALRRLCLARLRPRYCRRPVSLYLNSRMRPNWRSSRPYLERGRFSTAPWSARAFRKPSSGLMRSSIRSRRSPSTYGRSRPSTIVEHRRPLVLWDKSSVGPDRTYDRLVVAARTG